MSLLLFWTPVSVSVFDGAWEEWSLVSWTGRVSFIMDFSMDQTLLFHLTAGVPLHSMAQGVSPTPKSRRQGSTSPIIGYAIGLTTANLKV